MALLDRAFSAAGVTNPIRFIRNGQEALDYLAGKGEYSDRDLHPLPTLVLTNLELPKKSGFDIIKAIRSRPETRGIPLIVLNGSEKPVEVRRAYALGANSYLKIPTHAEALVELVRLVRQYWMVLNRNPITAAREEARSRRSSE